MGKKLKNTKANRRKEWITIKEHIHGQEVSAEDVRVVLYKDDHTTEEFEVQEVLKKDSVIYWAIEDKPGVFKRDAGLISTGDSSSLIDDFRIGTVITYILMIAQEGGMSENRTKELFDEITGCYERLSSEGSETFFDALEKIKKGRRTRP